MSKLSIRVWSKPLYRTKFAGLYEISDAGQVVQSGRMRNAGQFLRRSRATRNEARRIHAQGAHPAWGVAIAPTGRYLQLASYPRRLLIRSAHGGYPRGRGSFVSDWTTQALRAAFSHQLRGRKQVRTYRFLWRTLGYQNASLLVAKSAQC